ncbi:hypothetical protein SAMN06265348_114137 [Pedobacter westerhofensis]|uniref:Outer membrane protein beta-barrel domain-containing protein n=1 Tax=Pedobacter westerhofensis TaxID=425512 RepID=A0A521FNA2_9SPHI|nr:hypothetical protein [Pedobacter westerhofensis]SMO97678.1 hypothetical protein SAMN06265348_114137 [Pedobacter westerhofensis]
MEQSNKELIKEIADLFEDYEESYVPGEWESFLKHKKKKYPFFPNWIKVAAVLFLIVSVFAYNRRDLLQQDGKGSPAAQQQTANTTGAAKKSNGPAEKPAGAAQQLSAVRKSTTVNSSKSNSSIISSSALNFSQFKAVNTNPATVSPPAFSTAEKTAAADQGSVVVAENKINASAATIVPAPSLNQALAQTQLKADAAVPPAQLTKDSLMAPKKPKLSTSEFLLAESKKADRKEIKKPAVSKWDFGLQVMPTATHTNMNFGGGLVTAYHISDKISLSSGITLMQLGSGENVSSAAPAAASGVAYSIVKSSAESRQLLAVDANIKAIDIPLGLVYKVTKHYYTSAGISYFNVLSEKRNNTYSETVPVNKMSRDPSTGEVMSFSALETQQVDEEATDRPLKGNSYLGFFNFSIGRRQNIFKQYNIQIEPFIKVPIGKLSSQDLNLMNSGIKFQLSF